LRIMRLKISMMTIYKCNVLDMDVLTCSSFSYFWKIYYLSFSFYFNNPKLIPNKMLLIWTSDSSLFNCYGWCCLSKSKFPNVNHQDLSFLSLVSSLSKIAWHFLEAHSNTTNSAYSIVCYWFLNSIMKVPMITITNQFRNYEELILILFSVAKYIPLQPLTYKQT